MATATAVGNTIRNVMRSRGRLGKPVKEGRDFDPPVKTPGPDTSARFLIGSFNKIAMADETDKPTSDGGIDVFSSGDKRMRKIQIEVIKKLGKNKAKGSHTPFDINTVICEKIIIIRRIIVITILRNTTAYLCFNQK
jgi:hypothetical protein